MLTLLSLLILIGIVAATWFLGTWNTFLNLITTMIAAMVASSFFEPVADLLESADPTYTYVWDFVSLWGLFFITFGVVRLGTDLLTRFRLTLNIWVDMGLRSLFSIWTAWVFLCFMMMTLHTAPIPIGTLGFQETPQQRNIGLGPDRMWLAFVQSRSRGALAESRNAPLLPAFTQELHPDDQALNARVFDSRADFIYKYQARRNRMTLAESIRVPR